METLMTQEWLTTATSVQHSALKKQHPHNYKRLQLYSTLNVHQKHEFVQCLKIWQNNRWIFRWL